MPSIFEITGWPALASFLVWTLAVYALTRALFHSFLAAELRDWLERRDLPCRRRIMQLDWELAHRVRWNEAVAQGVLPAVPIRLTDEEFEAKHRERQQLTRNSFAWRAFTYFMGSFACQTFWTAVTVFATTRGVGDVEGWFFSAAAYSGTAALLAFVPTAAATPQPTVASPKCGCRGCGT